MGSQRPRVEVVPSWALSQVDDAAFFSTGYGLTPDPWQWSVLECWLSTRPDGRWAASEAGLAVPRQNGKNGALEIRELYGMVALGERFLHTAHEVKTARKAFIRLAGFFENPRAWPELAELVLSIRKTNGQEAIVLRNGGSVEFVARSRGSGRGYTVDVLVGDEAQELTDEQQEALLPTISAAPTGNPQVILTGTPPPPESGADVFRRMRKSATEGVSKTMAWHEWSVGDEFDADDFDVWAATNPALGLRLHPEVIVSERGLMSDDGFARERLGWWGSGRRGGVIDGRRWAALREPMPSLVEPFVFAFDVTPDRSSSSISVAARTVTGEYYTEVLDNRPGTGWVIQRLVELDARWEPESIVVDPKGPGGALVAGLQESGVEVEVLTSSDVAKACGLFYDLVVNEVRLRHFGQPVLNEAVDAARKRNLGDAWAWHRRDLTDISPLTACTFAVFAHQRAMGEGWGPPEKKQMVVFS